MNVNETLRQLREAIAKADAITAKSTNYLNPATSAYQDVALLAEALDTWLSDGGFLPDDWK